MKTVADLKRDANGKKIELLMTQRGTDNEIPPRLQGWRRAVKANSVSISVCDISGKESSLYLPPASLVEYDEANLTIYNPGLRDLTPDEVAVMDEWNKLASTDEARDQYYSDAMTDGTTMFYREKWFYQKNNMLYLMGLEKVCGKKLDFESGKILDDKIKGSVLLKYKVRPAA